MKQNLRFLMLALLCAVFSTAWGESTTQIASATFDGKNATYTEGWTTTGTGNGRADCIIIGYGENITSPSFDLSNYSKIKISIKARRYGTLSGSKATIDVSIGSTSVGTVDATGTTATTQLGVIEFTPTTSMTAATLVFTCTNATSPGSSHGAGINSITITGVSEDGETIEMPTFSPNAGTFTEAQTVSISCATTGATIYYTTDGNDPSASSTEYSSPITISETTTLKAIAIKDGVSSSIASATYTIEEPTEGKLIASGEFNGKDEQYPEGWTTTGTGKGRTDCIIIGADENITSPSFDLSKYSKIKISIKARRFGTLSGSKATIDVSIGGTSVGTVDATGTNASSQLDDIEFYPTSSMTAATLVFTCTNATSPGSTHGAGINSITIIGIEGEPIGVDAPTFSLEEGTYTETQTVSISCATTGATIYYTTNGNNPSSSSSVYSTPITISETTTLKAIAIKDGVSSPVASATYTIDLPAVSIPVFTPDEGTYTEAQKITITCATEGATIYYTTDETDPTQESTLYSSPVSITTTGTTLKAIAVKDGLVDSNVASATYIIQPEKPSISEKNGEIVITAAKGLSIYYTTDGSDPTNTSEEYSSPIPFTGPGTVTVKAIAYDAYNNPSAVSTERFSNIGPDPKEINSGYYVKVTSESDLEDGDAILLVYEGNQVAMSTTQNENNRGQVDVILGSDFIVPSEDVQKIILVGATGAWYFYVDGDETGYLYAASSSKNYLRTQETPDDNAKATISFDDDGNATIAFQGSNTRNLLKYNSGSSIFSCYASGQSAVQIYKEVEAQTEPVNIGSTKYATLYYGNENLIVPANVTAMTYKANGDKIAVSKTYATGEVIPKGTAVVLEGTAAGAYNFIVTTADGEGDSESDLYGLDVAGTTPAPGEGEYYYYKLSKASKDAADTTVGFYFGATDGGQFALSAPHRAYLAIPKNGTGVSAFVFDETVGISQIKNVISDDSIYTLSGVKVSNNNLSKGIYIVNGKKIVIK